MQSKSIRWSETVRDQQPPWQRAVQPLQPLSNKGFGYPKRCWQGLSAAVLETRRPLAKGVGKNMGPFTELGGENENRPITDFNFSITTDKNGNFTGVKEGDKTYNIGDWNKRFTSQSTQKQE